MQQEKSAWPAQKKPPADNLQTACWTNIIHVTAYSFFSKEPFSWHWGHFCGLQRPSLLNPHDLHCHSAILFTPPLFQISESASISYVFTDNAKRDMSW